MASKHGKELSWLHHQETENEATMRHHCTATGTSKIQSTDTTKCGEEVQQQEPAGGDANGAAQEDSLAVSYKTKQTPTTGSSNCAPWYLPK